MARVDLWAATWAELWLQSEKPLWVEPYLGQAVAWVSWLTVSQVAATLLRSSLSNAKRGNWCHYSWTAPPEYRTKVETTQGLPSSHLSHTHIKQGPLWNTHATNHLGIPEHNIQSCTPGIELPILSLHHQRPLCQQRKTGWGLLMSHLEWRNNNTVHSKWDCPNERKRTRQCLSLDSVIQGVHVSQNTRNQTPRWLQETRIQCLHKW